MRRTRTNNTQIRFSWILPKEGIEEWLRPASRLCRNQRPPLFLLPFGHRHFVLTDLSFVYPFYNSSFFDPLQWVPHDISHHSYHWVVWVSADSWQINSVTCQLLRTFAVSGKSFGLWSFSSLAPMPTWSQQPSIYFGVLLFPIFVAVLWSHMSVAMHRTRGLHVVLQHDWLCQDYGNSHIKLLEVGSEETIRLSLCLKAKDES